MQGFLKVIIVIEFLVATVSLAMTVVNGYRTRLAENTRREVLLGYHRAWKDILVCATVLAVLTIEPAARLLWGNKGGALFWQVHLPAAAAYTLLLCAALYWSGVRSPRMHYWLVHGCYLCAVIAFPTGIYLLFAL
ncbi:MAG TPA: hypothetical protein VG934_01070 [Candidatus Paceibacterota bacterium]|nr:hypothetical protein [Candidatus Paceibacterota bacterium]